MAALHAEPGHDDDMAVVSALLHDARAECGHIWPAGRRRRVLDALAGRAPFLSARLADFDPDYPLGAPTKTCRDGSAQGDLGTRGSPHRHRACACDPQQSAPLDECHRAQPLASPSRVHLQLDLLHHRAAGPRGNDSTQFFEQSTTLVCWASVAPASSPRGTAVDSPSSVRLPHVGGARIPRWGRSPVEIDTRSPVLVSLHFRLGFTGRHRDGCAGARIV